MAPSLKSLILLSLLSTIASACDPEQLLGSDSQTEDSEDQEAVTKNPRTDRDYPDTEPGTCDAWKFSYCDAIATCSAFSSRETCELDLGWLTCLPEAPLRGCQIRIEQALDDEDCESLPKDCTPEQIADRTLPYELCEEIHSAMCEYRLYCGLEHSIEACTETLQLVEPCESFTSFLPTAVDCADAYSRLACDQPMPEVCAGALRR